MSDCRFGVSPVNYPDPDPVHVCRKIGAAGSVLQELCHFVILTMICLYYD